MIRQISFCLMLFRSGEMTKKFVRIYLNKKKKRRSNKQTILARNRHSDIVHNMKKVLLQYYRTPAIAEQVILICRN